MGGGYEDLIIYDADKFTNLNKENTNILISSIYIPQISQKVFKLGFLNIYTFIDFILEKDTNDFKFQEYKNNEKYIKELKILIKKFNDEESLKYLNTILNSIMQGKALNEIAKIYTNEPQYFLKSIRHLLNDINILDAGAYTGDTLREMINLGIQPNNVYCFEADINNFNKLKTFKYELKNINNVHFKNYALWNEKTFIGMCMNNYNARVDSDSKLKNIETAIIDEYFKNISIGFIKMDIEGAERHALAGGIKVIERDRPILAISIYHSLDDIVQIPNMLMKKLNNYNWFIRKHSATYSEAILYGLPKEKAIK